MCVIFNINCFTDSEFNRFDTWFHNVCGLHEFDLVFTSI